MIDANSELPDIKMYSGTSAADSELVFDFFNTRPIYRTRAATIEAATANTWPHLKGKGVAISHLVVNPCTVGVPHIHPFSDEIVYGISGSNVTSGIKKPGTPLFMISELRAGQLIIIPQGSLHFFINLNCEEKLEALQMYPDDEDIKTITFEAQINDIPNEILHASLNIDIDEAESIKDELPSDTETMRLSQYCLKRCGLKL